MSSGAANTYPRLLGDIGGTNARFALIRSPGGPQEDIRTLSGANYPGPAEAIEAYLAEVGGPRPVAGAIGIANPIIGDSIKMTNHTWAFSIEAVRVQLGFTHLKFINDFTALALSLPHLPTNELKQVGGGAAIRDRAIAVLGPGTGLGVSGLVPSPGGYIALEGEGGHVTLPATTPEEAEVIDYARNRHPHVSAERLVCGHGQVLIYQALAVVRGARAEDWNARTITDHAMDGSNALALDSVNMFCAMLGTIAGNLALTLGAKGGVYLGGGIIPRMGDFFATTPFRQRFDAKGRFQEYLETIPVFVIHSAFPALTGAAVALEQALA